MNRLWTLRKLTKRFKPKYIRRQILFRYRLPQVCSMKDVNREALHRVAVFGRSKIVFNRLRKNANSTAMIALTRLENGLLLNSRTSKREACDLDDFTALAYNLSVFDWLLIIRDPYSRTLSAFLEKFRREDYIRKYGNFALSPDGFHRFLCWLKNGGLSADYHWNLQTAHLLLPTNYYSRIIRFETFDPDFLRFLQDKNPSIDSKFLAECTKLGTPHSTQSHAKIDTFYTKATTRLVSELFEVDFRTLGYSFKD